MTRSLVPRLVALVLVIVLGVSYIFLGVLKFRLTSQPFQVTVLMPAAGGLYAGANVTYRGVQIGTVSALDLEPGGVAARLSLDPGTRLPDDGPVFVKELSALGEQYLDFQPTTAGAPDVHAGSVIPASRVVLPTAIGSTLVDLGTLLRSVQPSDVRTVERFLATAFIGTGPGLRTIIVTGQRLFDALVAAQPETVNLIVDGRTDLRTLQATDGDLATFARGLASLTRTLRNSNSDVQALIRNGSAAAQQLDPFLASNTSEISALITDLATDSQVAARYQPQVRAIFELLPVVAGDLAAIAPDGQVHGLLEFNTADTVCPYILGSQMPGPTQKVSQPALSNTCSTSAPDLLQRGASSSPTFAAGG